MKLAVADTEDGQRIPRLQEAQHRVERTREEVTLGEGRHRHVVRLARLRAARTGSEDGAAAAARLSMSCIVRPAAPVRHASSPVALGSAVRMWCWKSHARVVSGRLPLRKLLREGAHHAKLAKARRNTVPSAARRSMAGVCM